MNIQFLENEYWWGGLTDEGQAMPYGVESNITVDLCRDQISNQFISMFLSNKGRILYRKDPYTITFSSGKITCPDDVTFREGCGDDLRSTYLAAMEAFFPFDGDIPDEDFFKVPQYNTWIEMHLEQNQEGTINYAKSILKNGMAAGIIMVDEGWALYNGCFKVNKGKFPDFKQMTDRLHEMGFKVMVWVTPMVTCDTEEYRRLRDNNWLVREASGDPAIRGWWDGYSAVMDLTNPDMCAWFKAKLNFLMEEYGIDGFKFDAGDPYMYRDDDMLCEPMKRGEHMKRFQELGLKYKLNEFRASYNMAGRAISSRLADRAHSWDHAGLASVIPNTLAQGITGYVYNCPDMIGGGDSVSFEGRMDRLDQELIVRYSQACALCTMMQFSLAPWRVLDKENFRYIVDMAALHTKFGGYILELAKHAAKTGEPITRYMEYQFPHQGYETVKDQFMLGDKILVAPVLEKGQREKLVRFPQGTWKDAQGRRIEGGCERIEAAPLGTLLWYEKL